MIIPIRCFSCGKVIADKLTEYQEYIKQGKTSQESMNLLGLTRYCCRRMLLGNIELLDNMLKDEDDIKIKN